MRDLRELFYPRGGGWASSSARRTPSWRPAHCQAGMRAGSVRGVGAVSARNCSIAAVTAAASSGELAGGISSIRGRGGLRLPLRVAMLAHPKGVRPPYLSLMIPVFDADTVLAAVSPADANDYVRDAFVRHARGEWEMPGKVYVDAGPEAVERSGVPGDFRAMPARGGG